LGDADGVVVVPRGQDNAVLDFALQIEAAEDAIRDAISRGERLDEARRRAGYFELQRRRERERR
ncbi:MAG: RraA family protein, partial [Burkholderiales bacterium]